MKNVKRQTSKRQTPKRQTNCGICLDYNNQRLILQSIAYIIKYNYHWM